MRLTFWGTRGSLPKPGPKTLRYGGNTSCVEVVSDAGTLVMFDCGTGAHALGHELLKKSPVRGHILVSHTHWDHIQGIPFFRPLFVPGNELDIYGPTGFGQSLRDSLAGQMQYAYFPVTLDALGAHVRFHNLVEGSFELDDIHVRARYLNHPALTLGYRLEVDGVSVVYACDHEPHSRDLATGDGEIGGQDRAHAEFLRDADLVIHDAQYTVSEYPSKVGWGHSTAEYAVRLCRAVGVKRLALTHHDPMREDDDIDHLIDALRAAGEGNRALEIFAAAEGHSIELTAERIESAVPPSHEKSALRVSAATGKHTILLGLAQTPEAEIIAQAARADELDIARSSGVDETLERYVEAWVDSKRFGKLSLGKGDSASNSTAEVDLSGTDVVQYASIADIAGGLLFRTNDDDLTDISVSDAFSDFDGLSRQNRVRYDTPRFYGFALAGSAISNQRYDGGLTWAGATGPLVVLAVVLAIMVLYSREAKSA